MLRWPDCFVDPPSDTTSGDVNEHRVDSLEMRHLFVIHSQHVSLRLPSVFGPPLQACHGTCHGTCQIFSDQAPARNGETMAPNPSNPLRDKESTANYGTGWDGRIRPRAV